MKRIIPMTVRCNFCRKELKSKHPFCKNKNCQWLYSKYPLTIIADRYGGSCSGGKYTAFPLDYDNIPHQVDSDDVSCATFWDVYDKPVGKGKTPKKALQNLIDKFYNELKEEV